MTRVFATISFVLCWFWSPAAQQTGLTDAQLKSAAVKVPRFVEALKLPPGMTVADVAAGFGAWTIQFSKWIGPTGRVYATDIGAPQLTALRDVVTIEIG